MIATDRQRVFRQQSRIDEHADRDKEYGTEEIPDRMHQRLDLIDLPGFRDDGADQKCTNATLYPSLTVMREIPKHSPTTVINNISSLLKRAT